MPAEYEVVPDVGIGPVRLGMTRAESRAAMGEEPREFLKGPTDEVPADAFHASSFQVFYGASERVEYIELSKSPEVEPIVFGEMVLQLKADDAIELVARHAAFDDSNPELGYSYVFPELELGDRDELADLMAGRAGGSVPSPAACMTVTGLLASAAALVAGRPRRLPRLRRTGTVGVSVVLGIRGACGVAGRTGLVSPGSTSPRFRRLDRRYYSPLCLALAATAASSARSRRG